VKQKNMQLLMVVVVGALLIQLAGLYDFRTLLSTTGGGAQVDLHGVGVCPDTGTIDLPFYGEETYADPATGVKAGVATTFSVYKNADPVAFTTAVQLTPTSGAASTSSDLPCGYEGAHVIANGSNGVTHAISFDLAKLPDAASANLIVKGMPQVSAVTLAFYNTTSGDPQATGMVQKWAASTTYSDIKLKITPDTTEIIEKPLLGIKWNACTVATDCNLDTAANTTVSISSPGWSPVACGKGGNAYDGYDDCFVADHDIANAQSENVGLIITTNTVYGGVSGQNATFLVSDIGEYVLNGKLYKDYINPVTGDRPTFGGTAGTGYIKFTSAA
jgi:hypothetical protein